jgi:hypothetical protein
MRIINKLMRKTAGWIILVIGAFGWLIPIPLVPFFLLFFIGIHILEYDMKFLELLNKLGIKTEKAEKYLKKTSFSKKDKGNKEETNSENQNTQDLQ